MECDVYVLCRWPDGFMDLQDGKTPLDFAPEKGNLPVVMALLDHDADGGVANEVC
jgi:hypothetical protein